jgi:hypothetical protein
MLNLSTLYSRRWHLDAIFFVNVFKGKISCCSIFDTVSIHISTRILRDYYIRTFMVNRNFKVSQPVNPSARCVSAAMLFVRTLTYLTRIIFR